MTSYGAAKASKPANLISPSRANSGAEQTTIVNEVVVASWKDASSRFERLSVSERQALLITLTANMGEEYTLDRRRETGKAVVFRLVGAIPFDMPRTNGPHGIDTGLNLGNWSDIREVTALTYGYLSRFERQRLPHAENQPIGPPAPGGPTRYDFYCMTLELIEAILADEQASLWIRCRKIFNGSIGKSEMRRLTLLILMMVPALIHEQLEFDHIRLKRTNEISLSSRVMHELMKKSEEILLAAARKPGTRWNPQRPK